MSKIWAFPFYHSFVYSFESKPTTLFSQHRENRVFWDLERLFGNIAVKIDLIAK